MAASPAPVWPAKTGQLRSADPGPADAPIPQTAGSTRLYGMWHRRNYWPHVDPKYVALKLAFIRPMH